MAAKKKSAGKKTATNGAAKKTSELRRNDKKKAILRLAKANPAIKAKDIIASLAKKGVTVTSNYVYKVLNAGKSSGSTASKAKSSSAPEKRASSSDAKALFTQAVQVLGVKRARKLLDILAALEQA